MTSQNLSLNTLQHYSCDEYNLIFLYAGCAAKLYVMAFTSTESGGGSDRHHDLFISLKNRRSKLNFTKTISFFNRQGDDMQTNKGDLWTFDFSQSEYADFPCFSPNDVDELAIVPTNSDDWHIESIATVLSMNTKHGIRFVPLTIDMEANVWIRLGDESFSLTNYESPHGCRSGGQRDGFFDMMGFPPLQG